MKEKRGDRKERRWNRCRGSASARPDQSPVISRTRCNDMYNPLYKSVFRDVDVRVDTRCHLVRERKQNISKGSLVLPVSISICVYTKLSVSSFFCLSIPHCRSKHLTKTQTREAGTLERPWRTHLREITRKGWFWTNVCRINYYTSLLLFERDWKKWKTDEKLE